MERPPRGDALIAPDDIYFDNEELPEQWEGKRWDEVDFEFLDCGRELGFIYFTPEAFHYYFAVFLMDVACVNAEVDASYIDELVSEVHRFVHLLRGHGNDRDKARWALFSKEDLALIADILRHYLDVVGWDCRPKLRKRILKQIEALDACA